MAASQDYLSGQLAVSAGAVEVPVRSEPLSLAARLLTRRHSDVTPVTSPIPPSSFDLTTRRASYSTPSSSADPLRPTPPKPNLSLLDLVDDDFSGLTPFECRTTTQVFDDPRYRTVSKADHFISVASQCLGLITSWEELVRKCQEFDTDFVYFTKSNLDKLNRAIAQQKTTFLAIESSSESPEEKIGKLRRLYDRILEQVRRFLPDCDRLRRMLQRFRQSLRRSLQPLEQEVASATDAAVKAAATQTAEAIADRDHAIAEKAQALAARDAALATQLAAQPAVTANPASALAMLQAMLGLGNPIDDSEGFGHIMDVGATVIAAVPSAAVQYDLLRRQIVALRETFDTIRHHAETANTLVTEATARLGKVQALHRNSLATISSTEVPANLREARTKLGSAAALNNDLGKNGDWVNGQKEECLSVVAGGGDTLTAQVQHTNAAIQLRLTDMRAQVSQLNILLTEVEQSLLITAAHRPERESSTPPRQQPRPTVKTHAVAMVVVSGGAEPPPSSPTPPHSKTLLPCYRASLETSQSPMSSSARRSQDPTDKQNSSPLKRALETVARPLQNGGIPLKGIT